MKFTENRQVLIILGQTFEIPANIALHADARFLL